MHPYPFYTLCLITYFLGAIPFGLLFVKWSGKGDIRDIGSGNIGTTNVLRTGSQKLALATLLADALKGTIPVLIAFALGANMTAACIIATIAILGHIFPIWLKFKGGKGVATALGTYLAINLPVCIACLLSWLVVAKIFRISSLSALIALLLAPIFAYIYGYYYQISTQTEMIFMSIVYLIILWTHRQNIRNILQGKETIIKGK